MDKWTDQWTNRLGSLTIPVDNFVNTGIRYCNTFLPIPVYNLANTHIQFGQYGLQFCQYGYMIWSILAKVHLGRFEVEIKDSKNMGVLEICLDIGWRIKKIYFATKVSLWIFVGSRRFRTYKKPSCLWKCAKFSISNENKRYKMVAMKTDIFPIELLKVI